MVEGEGVAEEEEGVVAGVVEAEAEAEADLPLASDEPLRTYVLAWHQTVDTMTHSLHTGVRISYRMSCDDDV